MFCLQSVAPGVVEQTERASGTVDAPPDGMHAGALMCRDTCTWKTCHASPGDIIPQKKRKEKSGKRENGKKNIINPKKGQKATLVNSILLYF